MSEPPCASGQRAGGSASAREGRRKSGGGGPAPSHRRGSPGPRAPGDCHLRSPSATPRDRGRGRRRRRACAGRQARGRSDPASMWTGRLPSLSAQLCPPSSLRYIPRWVVTTRALASRSAAMPRTLMPGSGRGAPTSRQRRPRSSLTWMRSALAAQTRPGTSGSATAVSIAARPSPPSRLSQVSPPSSLAMRRPSTTASSTSPAGAGATVSVVISASGGRASAPRRKLCPPSSLTNRPSRPSR